MRRVLLLVAGTAVAVTVLVGLRDHGAPVTGPRPVVASPGSVSPGSVSPAPPTYRTGTALGRPVQTDYGVVQVRVTTRGGRIVDVVPVRLPHEVEMDVVLSRTAVRQLALAVLDAQSADVDVVSGATYTSRGYLQSLQSALDGLR
jgi:uncharacterized protein with FMN-binding domain